MVDQAVDLGEITEEKEMTTTQMVSSVVLKLR